MGDFLVDFRPQSSRSMRRAAQALQFAPHTRSFTLDNPALGLIITYNGDPDLWAPYQDQDGMLIGVAGRVTMDESVWREADAIQGPGGRAARALYALYRRQGIAGLERLGGNRVITVLDTAQGNFHLLTDCCGAFPAFELTASDRWICSSHPDTLADAAGEAGRLDEVSLAEFLMSGTVTPPFTYYQRIRNVDFGTVTTVPLHHTGSEGIQRRRYFELSFRGDPSAVEQDLAEDLAAALKRSIRRRTLPHLGTTAVALSGGLDSRAILACLEDTGRAFAFTLYNEPNNEFSVAEAVARAARVRFVPCQRGFDYYADNAELGVRISGGMGSLANNHFLGILDRLHAEGMRNLLTGCYFDYLFKGLPLNRRTHWLTGRESLGPFQHQFYFGHRARNSPMAERVHERWEARIPARLRNDPSPEAVFQIEAKRTFPLCYEGDNQQRLVPQRLTGWCVPVAEPEVLEVYCRIPYLLKLNRSLFSKSVAALVDSRIAAVPDANTGAKLGASVAEETARTHWRRLARRLGGNKRRITTEGSWPDWQYYVTHSKKLEDLWQQPNPDAMDFLRRVAGGGSVRQSAQSYQGDEAFLLLLMLTLKLWFGRRA